MAAVKRELAKRLEELEGRFTPPSPPISELPIEEWVREVIEQRAPAQRQYDEDFFRWYEDLGSRLASTVRGNIIEAWGLDGLSGEVELDDDEIGQIQERVEASAPPLIDAYWQEWQANKPKRDQEIIAMGEFAASIGDKEPLFPNTDSPEEIRRRADAYQARPPRERLGRDWWISYHRERADLAEKYADFAEDWGEYYEVWKAEHRSLEPEESL